MGDERSLRVRRRTSLTVGEGDDNRFIAGGATKHHSRRCQGNEACRARWDGYFLIHGGDTIEVVPGSDPSDMMSHLSVRLNGGGTVFEKCHSGKVIPGDTIAATAS